MRLINIKYDIEIELKENVINCLSIENQELFLDFLRSLYYQAKGGEGNIIISNNDISLNLNKELDIIFNPFSLDINNKKIISNLYFELSTIATDEFFEETSKLNSHIIMYLEKLFFKVPYCIETNLEFNLSGLMKLYDIKIQEEMELNKLIINYIKLMHQICNVNVFVIVNAKQYFSKNQLQYIYFYYL